MGTFNWLLPRSAHRDANHHPAVVIVINIYFVYIYREAVHERSEVQDCHELLSNCFEFRPTGSRLLPVREHVREYEKTSPQGEFL